MNLRAIHHATTITIITALINTGCSYHSTPTASKNTMVDDFCKHINGSHIIFDIPRNETCQSYFYHSDWLSNYRINALKNVAMSESFDNDGSFTLNLSEKSIGNLTFIKASSLYRFSSDINSQSTTILNHQTKQQVKTTDLINPKYQETIKSAIQEQFKTIITKHQQDQGTIHWIGLPRSDKELADWLSDEHIDEIYQAGFLNDDLTLNYCANGNGGGDDRTFQDCISIPAKTYLINGIL